jgi:hypothetical protein
MARKVGGESLTVTTPHQAGKHAGFFAPVLLDCVAMT